MSTNYKKHRILRELKYHWEGTQHYQNGNLPLEDRSLEVEELSDRLRIKDETVQDVCISLDSHEFVKAHMTENEDTNEEPYRFYITQKGKNAVTDKTFLNLVWWRKLDFYKFLLPLLLAIIALLNSIFHWWETS